MAAVAVAAVDFGVDAEHAGDVGTLHEAAVEHVLPQVVELVGKDAPSDSNGVVGFLADHPVQHFSEPPDSLVSEYLPFLCHWFRIAKTERLISTRN